MVVLPAGGALAASPTITDQADILQDTDWAERISGLGNDQLHGVGNNLVTGGQGLDEIRDGLGRDEVHDGDADNLIGQG